MSRSPPCVVNCKGRESKGNEAHEPSPCHIDSHVHCDLEADQSRQRDGPAVDLRRASLSIPCPSRKVFAIVEHKIVPTLSDPLSHSFDNLARIQRNQSRVVVAVPNFISPCRSQRDAYAVQYPAIQQQNIYIFCGLARALAHRPPTWDFLQRRDDHSSIDRCICPIRRGLIVPDMPHDFMPFLVHTQVDGIMRVEPPTKLYQVAYLRLRARKGLRTTKPL